MINTQNIADAVGRAKMAEALEVGATAVSKAVVGGKFPPSWLSVMEILCAEVGIDCPRELFVMRGSSPELRVGNPPKVQGQRRENPNSVAS